ncbi:acetyltransferase, GNAT family [Pseudoflavonifractor capillosus ATCC 29799]|uniref:Acetyltransferase, GNAT family n=2 Tax=Pseudoflavonifractor capillosus TaxID=106588 RepID=A6NW49_9FIRM|nr:acetyltransferase, GNAT family [Pseudoflavonifractor capillosus ATCC 29799]
MVVYEDESCMEGSRFLTLQSTFGGEQMKNEITIREAVTEQEIGFFWAQLRAYFNRDIFPDPDSGEKAHFLDDQYRSHMDALHQRERDRCYYLLLSRNGEDIGLALPVLYHTEDGKCFLCEFCVFPEFRGNGTGRKCGERFLAWARSMGAAYVELNCDTPQRQRFWGRLGFRRNGADEWGMPLMLLPPEEELPIRIERLTDGGGWQLKKLENGFLREIGEDVLTEEKKRRLEQAVFNGEITYFLAKRGYRAVGMCSVATAFSTFTCGDVGTFEDFYIEPVFRGKGIARMLAETAQKWCGENGIASLSVTCAPCDEQMYQALGFQIPLGRTYAYPARGD